MSVFPLTPCRRCWWRRWTPVSRCSGISCASPRPCRWVVWGGLRLRRGTRLHLTALCCPQVRLEQIRQAPSLAEARRVADGAHLDVAAVAPPARDQP